MLEGVFHVLSTPFTADGELDVEGVGRLVDAVLPTGIAGLTILGATAETHKLSAAEQQALTRAALQAVEGRIPVVAGTTRPGTRAAVDAAAAAADAGADAVMVAPPPSVGTLEELTPHYAAVAAVGCPIVLQDYPAASGVVLAPEAIVELVRRVPQIAGVKMEDTPAGRRVAAIRALAADLPLSVCGGLSALWLIDELRAGTRGTMTGFALPEVLVEIVAAWLDGEHDHAIAVHARHAALLVRDAQAGTGIAVRKQMLHARGWIDTPLLRAPGVVLDDDECAQVDHLVGIVTRPGSPA